MQSTLQTVYTDYQDPFFDGASRTGSTMASNRSPFDGDREWVIYDAFRTSDAQEPDLASAVAVALLKACDHTQVAGNRIYAGRGLRYNLPRAYSAEPLVVNEEWLTRCRVASGSLHDDERWVVDDLINVLSGAHCTALDVNGFEIFRTTPLKSSSNKIASEEVSEDVRSVLSVMEDEQDAVTTEQIAALIGIIERLVRNGKLNDIDIALRLVSTTRCAPASLIATLRTLFPVKEFVPHWASFLGGVSEELARRGLDSKKLLRGL